MAGERVWDRLKAPAYYGALRALGLPAASRRLRRRGSSSATTTSCRTKGPEAGFRDSICLGGASPGRCAGWRTTTRW